MQAEIPKAQPYRNEIETIIAKFSGTRLESLAKGCLSKLPEGFNNFLKNNKDYALGAYDVVVTPLRIPTALRKFKDETTDGDRVLSCENIPRYINEEDLKEEGNFMGNRNLARYATGIFLGIFSGLFSDQTVGFAENDMFWWTLLGTNMISCAYECARKKSRI